MSGFRRTVRIDTNKKWDDRIYVNYTLALVSTEMDAYFPVKSTDVYHDDKGWRW